MVDNSPQQPGGVHGELDRILDAPKQTGELIDVSILEGEGVSARFIEACKDAAGRFMDLDYHTFPRDQQGVSYCFFEGEHLQRGGRNPVNNPMHLIRPRVLSSPSNMVYYGIDNFQTGPNNYAKTEGERGYQDTRLEILYAGEVRDYETLFVRVLEATNADSADEAETQVRSALDRMAANHNDMHVRLARETPAGWLMHACLSVLLHPSEEITPAGRVRALALLNLYSVDELAEGFTSGSVHARSFYGSGLVGAVKPRVPHTLCEPHERHLEDHEDWIANPRVAEILGPLRSGDYRTASNSIVSHPLEAVQLSVLSLMNYGKERFGIELLRTLPTLDRPTLALMFGRHATFYVDNRISNKLGDQVAEGAGLRFDPTLSFEGLDAELLRRASKEDLQRILGAVMLRLRRAEDIIASLAGGGIDLLSAQEQDKRDPEGFCKTLGIDPGILSQYTDEELEIIIRSAHKAMTRLHSAQAGPPDEARQQQLNIARDRLLNKGFRESYGRRV